MFIDPLGDPLAAFAKVRAEVGRTAPDGFDPDTMALGTCGADGQPAVRIVLVRVADADGLVFFTNYTSRKAADLDENPRAALTGYWHWLKQQVRVEGVVTRVCAAMSDAYFASRPRGSQLGAWASRQSQPIMSRGELETSLADAERRFGDRPVPRPEGWGGFRLEPDRIEFWEEGAFRLHDRVLFSRLPGGRWTRQILCP
jgi:pyridoxamine 5'-phosphate oxidase